MPQAEEAHDRRRDQDRAGQEQGELETAEKGGGGQVKCVLAGGRGGDVDLTDRDVGPGPGCPLLLGWGQGSGLAVPLGQGHRGPDRSQDGQSGRGADLAAGIEQA
jgi:hypothetical protein